MENSKQDSSRQKKVQQRFAKNPSSEHPDSAQRVPEGVYQIGEEYALSWIVAGCFVSLISIPKATAS